MGNAHNNVPSSYDQGHKNDHHVTGSADNSSSGVAGADNSDISLTANSHLDICISDNFKSSRIRNVYDIVGKQFGSERVFDTTAHFEIFTVLVAHVQNLESGRYVSTQGVCSATLVGAKGIGKTSCFKIFTALAPYVSTVIVIYVSFNSDGSVILARSLSSTVAMYLEQKGLQVPNNNNLTISENIIDALTHHDRHLLILADELDQLYKLDGNKHQNAVASLSDLAYFGNQPSGRISVLVCGSSALMENLITTNASDHIRAEFPLLATGAINLNGTKFRTKRVYSTLPTDLKAVASICGQPFDSDFVQLFRLIAYVTGCSARNVKRLLCDTDNGGYIIGSTSPENSLTGANTLANDHISHLRKGILKGLIKKNKVLLAEIFGKSVVTGDLVVDRICSTNWEDRLKPLTFQEMELIWKSLERKKKVQAASHGDLSYYVLHLTDRCWLTVSGVRDSKPEFIFPFSLSSLGAEMMSSANKESVLKLATERVKKCIQGTVANPQIVPRVASAVVAAHMCVIS